MRTTQQLAWPMGAVAFAAAHPLLPRLPMRARAMAHLLLEPAGLLMERKMLLSIEQRVEAHRTG